MSQGYEDDSAKPKGYELISLAPAGSLAATGADMARFMIAHLQNGAFGDQRILSEETAKTMHGTPLTIIPDLNRMLLGLLRDQHQWPPHHLRTAATRSTSTATCSSTSTTASATTFRSTAPARKARSGRSGRRSSAASAIVTFPGPTHEGKVDEATAKEHAAAIAGSYIFARRAESSLLQRPQPRCSRSRSWSTRTARSRCRCCADLNGEPDEVA